MLNRLVQTSVENIRECLVRLENDANALFHWAGIDVKRLVTIQTSGGDRHRGGRQVLVLTFGESKVVYKPTYLYADQLYAEFVNLLALHPPYDLRSAQILPRNGYGWLEFIDFVPCKSEHEVRSYYQRAGALLAVADTLNYCDGHFENLIAHGAYPVLIDCETLFHAFGSVQDFGGERSIFFTGLIQPLVGEEPIKRGLSAAFQVYGGKRNHILHTYAVEDHTDNLQVRFRGSTEETSFNSAVYDGSFQWAGKYVAEVVDGYRTTYDRITSCSTLILNNSDWWKKLSVVHVRQLVRHTMYYLFVLRKLQQPESCVDETTAREVIRALLGSEDHKANQLIAYEINDLVNNDIPYFYHYPGERNLYDSAGKCYSGFFEQSVTDEIRTQLETRSDTYRNRQVEIIEKHLPLSPLRIE